MKSLDKRIDSALGALIGAAVGDALGAPLEFLTPKPKDEWVREMNGGGVLQWEPGAITDDTTMSLAVCEMYAEKGGYDQRTLVEKWLRWKNTGPKDIGAWTHSALSKWSQYLRNHDAKTPGEVDVFDVTHPVIKLWNDAGRKDAGNGGVMRCFPTALWEPFLEERVKQASRICMDTHPDPRCIESCVLIVEGLHELIEREFDSVNDAADIFEKMTDEGGLIRNGDLIDAVIDSQYVKLDSLNNGGYTVDTIHCALAAFRLSESFEEGLVGIVNRGNDADTVGAVAGAIMGAYYGYSSIPERWLEKLQSVETLMDHVQKMYTRKCRVGVDAENPE